MRVAVRTRPTAAFNTDEIAVDSAEQTVDIRQKTPAGDVVNNRQEAWAFRYHHVMHNSSQVGHMAKNFWLRVPSPCATQGCDWRAITPFFLVHRRACTRSCARTLWPASWAAPAALLWPTVRQVRHLPLSFLSL